LTSRSYSYLESYSYIDCLLSNVILEQKERRQDGVVLDEVLHHFGKTIAHGLTVGYLFLGILSLRMQRSSLPFNQLTIHRRQEGGCKEVDFQVSKRQGSAQWHAVDPLF
jgi:hypothetical protein